MLLFFIVFWLILEPGGVQAAGLCLELAAVLVSAHLDVWAVDFCSLAGPAHWPAPTKPMAPTKATYVGLVGSSSAVDGITEVTVCSDRF